MRDRVIKQNHFNKKHFLEIKEKDTRTMRKNNGSAGAWRKALMYDTQCEANRTVC